ncbi:MAG: dihydrolipoamide acetyltransferase family protein [Pseudomonadales bacterium]
MSEFSFKLPDLGEGTVEAEIIIWHVSPGDAVTEGQVIVDVMTDKANIEVPSPVSGRVLRTRGEPGDMITVGTELVAFDVSGKAPAATVEPPPPMQAPASPPEQQLVQAPPAPVTARREAPSQPTPDRDPASTAIASQRTPGTQVLASPAIRRRANELGIDLAGIAGSGPRGRILRKDLDGFLQTGPASTPAGTLTRSDDITEVKIIGVRRVIAQRMQAAKREIPHFAYVEEVDITALDSLRQQLNAQHPDARLTFLPFIGLALIRALKRYPHINALHDAERDMLLRHSAVHLGIATQTPDGLKVPVVRDADQLDLWQLAAAVASVAQRARDGSAGREELGGSTFTLTSLGRLGGIVSTPVINTPELGIVGINKAVQRPMVVDGRVEIRLMMNLSSSFDHRFVDGFDAASMIQAMKALLEQPALLFVPAPPG